MAENKSKNYFFLLLRERNDSEQKILKKNKNKNTRRKGF